MKRRQKIINVKNKKSKDEESENRRKVEQMNRKQ